MSLFRRYPRNPILSSNLESTWESEAVFNGCPVMGDDKIHFVYRAVSSPQLVGGHWLELSTIGYAQSNDGLNFKGRRQLIQPELEWEMFGCEDPRVVRLDDKYYIFYTALATYPFSAEGIKVGLAITKDFEMIEAKHPVTTFNSKAMTIFPERINGKIAALLTANTDLPPSKIGLAFFDREEDMWSKEYWEDWYRSIDRHLLPIRREVSDQVEVGAPPLKTAHGWLVLYSHIHDYLTPPSIFTVQALLLDLENPRKVLGQTSRPLMVTKEFYEKYGRIKNVIFPSGALIRGEKVYLYYGAADTTCAVATADLKKLVSETRVGMMVKLERFFENPILSPIPEHTWEAKAVFNPAAIYEGGRVHLVYRAMSEDNTSTLGYASSGDGLHFDERLPAPIYTPREPFEEKLIPGGNSGCEDPRLTRIGDTIYMCYTAFNGKEPPRVALTTIKLDDFLAHRWTWSRPVLISPPGVDDKDAAIFPGEINGKYFIFHRLGTDIWLDHTDNPNHFDGRWLKGRVIIAAKNIRPDLEKIGIASTPIETDAGWLLIYHAVSKKNGDRYYYLSAALLDKERPWKVISNIGRPILEPETNYEKSGQVNNVVFSCGSVVIEGELFVYYGAADKVIGVATIELDRLIRALE